MKNRILAIIACMTWTLALTACGAEETATASNSSTASISAISASSENTTGSETTTDSTESKASAETDATEAPRTPATDFTLQDQYGNTHTLSDYKGKVVFLNFWATWCPPCKAEMPDIQALYEEYQEAGDDSVVILGVAAPSMGREQDQAGVEAFLTENGYTYPIVMDTTGDVNYAYYTTSIPMTYMIDTEGNIFGYVTGQISLDTMKEIIRQTKEGTMEAIER